MPRTTLQLWICGHCRQTNRPPDYTNCTHCGASRREKHAQVHSSERAVVYYNPATGEHRTPPRADQPIPAVYQHQGFERREILNMQAWEKESGLVHEASNFSVGNEPLVFKEPSLPSASPAVREALVNDVRDAIASGPWTSSENSPSTFSVAPDLSPSPIP